MTSIVDTSRAADAWSKETRARLACSCLTTTSSPVLHLGWGNQNTLSLGSKDVDDIDGAEPRFRTLTSHVVDGVAEVVPDSEKLCGGDKGRRMQSAGISKRVAVSC